MEKIGLIPCAGKGSRLALPFSKELFPSVHTLSYNPIIMYTINSMIIAGIKQFVVTINPQKLDIIKYLENGKKFGINISYCIHPEPRSLPHSIDEAYHMLKDKKVVFAMPDTCITPSDFLHTLLNSHEKDKTAEVTLASFQTNNPSKFGMVDFNEKNGKVKEIYDKPNETTLKWMWGAMVWNPKFTELLHQYVTGGSNNLTLKETVLSDALTPLIEQEKVNVHCFQEGKYMDLGTYDEIIQWSKGEKGK